MWSGRSTRWHIGLCADKVVRVTLAGAWQQRVGSFDEQACTPDPDAAPWLTATAALTRLLLRLDRPPARAMLSDDKIAEIRDSVDLVALISEYAPLRRQGARFVGLCPFHTEKSPSFGVARGRNFYYCFGCQASGDAISFLRHVEGLSFMEALEKLAERAGIEIPRSDDPGQAAMHRARQQREQLAEVMGLAVQFFEEQLTHHPLGGIAQAAIEARGVRPEIAKKFRLGYAPRSWDALAQHFEKSGVSLRDASDVGLIAQRRQGPGYYDRFRHRLMFPVADAHGRVIAFSGRALDLPPGEPIEDPPPAKYMNSPEGPLYKKGQVLFGLHEARVAVRKSGQALLCEGNFDLVSIHQAGLENVLAPLGTAFTLEQAKLIRRFAEEVIVVFDGDSAGRKATHAAFPLLEGAGLRGRVVRLAGGQDPDTYIRAQGAEAFAALVKNAIPIVDFLIDDAADRATDAASRGSAIQSLGPLLARIESPVERGLYVEKVASRFNIRDLAAVKAELRRGVLESRLGKDGRSSRAPEPPRELQRPERPAPAPLRRPQDLPPLQCQVLAALLDQPSLFATAEAQRLDELLTDSDLQAIFRVTAQLVAERGEVDASVLLKAVESNPARAWLGERLSVALESKYDLELAQAALRDGLPRLAKKHREDQREQIKREIQKARQAGDELLAQELMRQRDKMMAEP